MQRRRTDLCTSKSSCVGGLGLLVCVLSSTQSTFFCWQVCMRCCSCCLACTLLDKLHPQQSPGCCSCSRYSCATWSFELGKHAFDKRLALFVVEGFVSSCQLYFKITFCNLNITFCNLNIRPNALCYTCHQQLTTRALPTHSTPTKFKQLPSQIKSDPHTPNIVELCCSSV